jgi:uncharacterized cupredoxin-like copper-binding protein
MRKLALVLAAASAAVVAASPVGASGTKTLVTVRLKEFKVLPAPLKAKRGVVAFSVRNIGTVNHELVVLKTTVPPGKLRVKSGKAVEVGRVGRVGPLKPRASRTLTLTLKVGKYVLLCNLPAHYQLGQRIGFAVT